MSGKNSERQFVDTNVLVYAHDTSAGEKHARAKALVTELWQSGNGCLSVQVLQEFYVTVTQKVRKPLSPETASRIIEYLSNWRVHTPDADDVLEAIRIHQRYAISFWDAMIIRSAEALDCRVVWSEDLNPGQYYGEVKVVNPFSC
ncbi:Predicted nucleic acid-binding protein, contains PIN domain [Thermanaeromonas toyohensis ToBE]|uniref:Predicted nucleic acid-binding protein, contains PIN domain n=1 Tax=Thermanaeromonas toyohensis ToBE TaxID=698762 RepID=A0A1W1VYW2_9FIRM|nr:PIN domain-containing protein [Thermanaeromonas toyohensis]SMB98301.1 Predicted nucleic acid-binding protein, contains PIN domain [Thermanaeromonas toyohensis ToBE]